MKRIIMNEKEAYKYVQSRKSAQAYKDRVIPHNLQLTVANFVEKSGVYQELKNVRLFFNKHYKYKNHSLQAQANFSLTPYITLNYEWVARIAYYCDDEDTRIAFRCTIGHELSHRCNDIWFIRRTYTRTKLCAKANDVYADFYGCKLMANGDVQLAIRAMKLKKSVKTLAMQEPDQEITDQNKSGLTWDDRIEYLQTKKFSEDLVRKLAQHSDFRGKENLIKVLYDHYPPIDFTESGNK